MKAELAAVEKKIRGDVLKLSEISPKELEPVFYNIDEFLSAFDNKNKPQVIKWLSKAKVNLDVFFGALTTKDPDMREMAIDTISTHPQLPSAFKSPDAFFENCASTAPLKGFKVLIKSIEMDALVASHLLESKDGEISGIAAKNLEDIVKNKADIRFKSGLNVLSHDGVQLMSFEPGEERFYLRRRDVYSFKPSLRMFSEIFENRVYAAVEGVRVKGKLDLASGKFKVSEEPNLPISITPVGGSIEYFDHDISESIKAAILKAFMGKAPLVDANVVIDRHQAGLVWKIQKNGSVRLSSEPSQVPRIAAGIALSVLALSADPSKAAQRDISSVVAVKTFSDLKNTEKSSEWRVIESWVNSSLEQAVESAKDAEDLFESLKDGLDKHSRDEISSFFVSIKNDSKKIKGLKDGGAIKNISSASDNLARHAGQAIEEIKKRGKGRELSEVVSSLKEVIAHSEEAEVHLAMTMKSKLSVSGEFE